MPDERAPSNKVHLSGLGTMASAGQARLDSAFNPMPAGAANFRHQMLASEHAGAPIKEVALAQLGSLIAAFQEVEDYDPQRHHNGYRPALWLDSRDYLEEIKRLVVELRRLNDLLKAQNTPDPAALRHSGSIVASMAEKACLSAADVIGKGIGYVILASVAAILIHSGVAIDAAQPLLNAIKGK